MKVSDYCWYLGLNPQLVVEYAVEMVKELSQVNFSRFEADLHVCDLYRLREA